MLFSLSDSSVCVGLWGASSRERREVFASDGIAYAGGSQDGVRANVRGSGTLWDGRSNMGMVFLAGDIQGDSSGAGETVRKTPSEGMKTAPDGARTLLGRPSEVDGREALDAQQLRRHSISRNSTRSCARFALCCSHSKRRRRSFSSCNVGHSMVSFNRSNLQPLTL